MKPGSLTPGQRAWLLLFCVPCTFLAAFVIATACTVAALTGSGAAGNWVARRIGP